MPSRFFHKTFPQTGKQARERARFDKGLTRTPNGTRTLFASLSQIAITTISASTLLNLRARDSQETFRRASRPRSLTIGSGSSAPAVTSRRRECKLPASTVSTQLSAAFRTLRPEISASPNSPRERPNIAPQDSVSSTRFPLWAENSPPLCLGVQTPS